MNVHRSAQVIVRHAAGCPDKAKGPEHKRCNCRKAIITYDGATKKQARISAKTRSWADAEKAAREWLESFDPLTIENKKLKAEKESKQEPIASAVKSYLADMAARNLTGGTVENARCLLDRLVDWLALQPSNPIHVADVTVTHLTDWRASWSYGDLTASQRLGIAKAFFRFCEGQKWVSDSPARHIAPSKATHGNRTAIFSDKQLAAIIGAAHGQPEMTAMLELLRWSGMAISDAVKFRIESVDANGVLHYKRQKTGELAVVPIPAHVRALLVGLGDFQPFYTNNIELKSNVRRWQNAIQHVFKKAGITEVRTESGRTRRPHVHMFRDSCAVSALRHGAKLHSVAKMLGHSNTRTTEKSYLPFCQELEEAHIADVLQAQQAMMPKPSRGRKIVNIANNR